MQEISDGVISDAMDIDALLETLKGRKEVAIKREETDISIDCIEVNPFQPRMCIDPIALKNLAVSIAEDGLIEPIIVRRMGPNRFQLMAGERRWRAIKEILGRKTIHAYIIKAGDKVLFRLTVAESVHINLNPIEEACMFQRGMKEFGYNQAEMAKMAHVTRFQISKRLGLLQLPKSTQDLIASGELPVAHADLLRSIKGTSHCNSLAKKMAGGKFSLQRAKAKIIQMESTGEIERERPSSCGSIEPRPARVSLGSLQEIAEPMAALANKIRFALDTMSSTRFKELCKAEGRVAKDVLESASQLSKNFELFCQVLARNTGYAWPR